MTVLERRRAPGSPVPGRRDGNEVVNRHELVDPATGELRSAFERLWSNRIYFAHHSVGANILAGLQRLGSELQVPLPLVELESPKPLVPGTWAHGRLGQNGDPHSKLRAFSELMHAGLARHVDVALFKLCYVDIGSSTDIGELFARYERTMEELRSSFPGTLFVSCTVPLTRVQGGWRGLLKQQLGRPVGQMRENARRHAFNQQLRGMRGPLFDLAALESTDELGRRETFELNGFVYPALVPAFTDDGGHLNDRGARRVARSLVLALASPESLTRPGASGKALSTTEPERP